MTIPEPLARTYKQHCKVIDFTDWPRFEKERIKKRILKRLKKDGYVDYNAFPPEYRWNLCSARLRSGDFTDWDGWEYRSSWFMNFMGVNGEKCPIPRWDYRPVNHLVIMGEQGVGDEILFLSALPDLMVRFGKKPLELVGYEKLNPIVERSYGIRTSPRRMLSEVIEGDAVMALGDLFKWYRNDVKHFPRKPFLKPDPEKVDFWRKWLEGYPKPWVGTAWFSRHGYFDPIDLKTGPGTYFNLQYDHKGPFEYVPFDTKDDMENLFAFVKALDRVQSVTQTLVHVAGSVGTECHAVIPPMNGEAKWYLWYHECRSLGDKGGFWPHLLYGSVTVYKDLDVFRNRRP